MEPNLFYDQKLQELQASLKILKRYKSSFGYLRLGSIAAIIFAFYILWSAGIAYVVIASVILIVIFLRLIYADLNNQAKINHPIQLIHINEVELKCLAGNFYDFPSGTEHIPKDHPYANDLDIFGRASLFQYINRTTSELGSRQIADYLMYPAKMALISERQKALKELSKKISWIHDLQASGRKKTITFLTKKRLNTWMKEPSVFSGFKPWKWLRYVLPLIILTIVTLFIFDMVSSTLFFASLFIFLVIAYQINKVVTPVHEKLSKIADELHTLSSSIAHIENEDFESPLLKKMQSAFISSAKATAFSN